MFNWPGASTGAHGKFLRLRRERQPIVALGMPSIIPGFIMDTSPPARKIRQKADLRVVINIDSFLNQRLGGVFSIARIELTHEPLVDALGREAVAQTRILGQELRMVIRSGLSDGELSATLYHEILEAATVASSHPPESVLDLNEAGFEAAARRAHQTWGEASVQNLNRMLQFYGFCGQ